MSTNHIIGNEILPLDILPYHSGNVVNTDLETIEQKIKDRMKSGRNPKKHELSDYNVEKTIGMVRTIIRKYGISEPTEKNAIKLKQKLQETGRSENTQRLYLIALRTWARAEGGDIDLNNVGMPAIEVISKIDGADKTKCVDRQSLHRVLHDESIHIRDRAFIALIAYCGLRLKNAVNLKIDEITPQRKIILRHTKNRHQGVIACPEPAYKIIKEWLDVRAQATTMYKIEHDLVFISQTTGQPLKADGAREMMYRIARKHGIVGKWCPHALRHTCATRMGETPGVTLQEIQDTLGHSSPLVTRIYVHTDAELLKKKLDAGMVY